MGGGSTSAGALVPSVKSEPVNSSGGAPHPQSTSELPAPHPAEAAEEHAVDEIDRDVLCPICMQIIRDAFLTSCGHSFCYMCIVTHLQNKSDCPCCSQFLTAKQLYPNFLLSKLLMKTSARQISKTSSPLEQLRQALEQGCEASVKDLESLLFLLAEKKSKMEQEEAETNLQILLDFLQYLVLSDLQYIKEDIHAVEGRRIEMYRRRDRYSTKMRILVDEPASKVGWPSLIDKHGGSTASRTATAPGLCLVTPGGSQNKITDSKSSACHLIQRKDSFGGSDNQNPNQSGLALARKRRIHAQFNELQECYLQKRRHSVSISQEHQEKNSHSLNREGYTDGLEEFQSVLTTFTQYSRLRVIAELRHGDLFHSANIVSSIEFDRDDQLFATAGVSRRIKIFEFSSVVNEPADVHCPVAEMSTRSKLSCLSWNKYTKNHIASSDYEGIVTVWDVATRQSVMEYEEHEKRAWSVDFSRMEPSMLVSGSDDCKVKIWCTKQEASVLNIDMKANICSVKYNPGSSFHVAVGSADHHIHYYDLRKISQPLYILSGHRKAVSYVKFLSNDELASASTDSTLRLWDVKDNVPLRAFRGHTNEKNFVGLTVNSEYIACGSETNEVFVYHKAISKPSARHRFCSDVDETNEDANFFISAVCWKSDSPTMLTANSQGTIRVLVLAP
ncbi:hypothetical protein F511_05887 [Dorcoceras hygrometricum]|uniref:RING-type domain-containing protein n=1 Tax=Dorcoceras hygrometricum TaxID=472368 RepID=A0A2Z7CVY6_9LAMI|nr:hypothetical protein F511_05887 [Dorcoceras hygrometricum]